MANRQSTVWTVLHEGDVIMDDNGMIPMFASKEGAEFFMDFHGMEAPLFKLKELTLQEVPPLPPTTPFKYN